MIKYETQTIVRKRKFKKALRLHCFADFTILFFFGRSVGRILMITIGVSHINRKL